MSMSFDNMTDFESLKEFILFLKSENVPSFTLNGFACTLPSKSVQQEKLDALQRDIEQLRSLYTSLAMEVKTRGRYDFAQQTPFTSRINAVRKE